jgi:hypothetical protein
MNWYSKTLNADNWFYYYETRIPGTPWTNPEDYLRFSPISLVGSVNTPTLVMVGLDDLRTPPSQAKQLYHALKYRACRRCWWSCPAPRTSSRTQAEPADRQDRPHPRLVRALRRASKRQVVAG